MLIYIAAISVIIVILHGIEKQLKFMFFLLDLGPLKRDRILDKDQYIILRHTMCGFDYNLTRQRGMSRYQNSYRARDNYRELTMKNGICRSSLQINGNKIIHTQNGKRHIVTVREFFPDRMITTKTVDKTVTLVKHYKAIQTNRFGRSMNF